MLVILDRVRVGIWTQLLMQVHEPTICSSPFQTHKRFKVRMLPTTVADVDTSVGGYGKYIDLVFNLDKSDTNK